MEPRRGRGIAAGLTRPAAVATLLAGAAWSGVDAAPTHHRLTVELVPAEHRLTATDRIQWTGDGPLRFTLHPALVPREVRVDGQPYAVTEGQRAGHWTGSKPLAADGPHQVTIRYRGRLRPGQAAEGFRDVLKGFPPRIAPTGTYLPAGGAWVPDLGSPRITYTLRLTGPADQRFAAAGHRKETTKGDRRQVIYAYDRPIPGVTVLGGPYQVSDGPDRSPAPLSAYLHAGLNELGPRYLAAAAGYLARYQERFGPYPHPRFALVSSPWPTGFGFPGMAYIGRRILPLPFIPRTSLPHEILHNWWGNGVYVAPDSGNWAEGLTTFGAEYRLARERSPAAARTRRRQWLADFASYHGERSAPALRQFDARIDGASRTLGYNKAAFVWLMLAERIGSKAFRDGLRRFYTEHRYRFASWTDLRRAFEAAAGEDLGGFFRQWLDRPGAPQPALAKVAIKGNQAVLTLTQPAPAYRLALPVRLAFEDGSTRTRVVHLDGRHQVVTLPLGDGNLTSVRVDPDFRVFRRLTPQAVPPRLSGILARKQGLRIALAEGLATEAGHSAATALGRALWDQAPTVQAGGEASGAPVRVVPMDQLAAAWDRLQPANRLPEWPAAADARVALVKGPQGDGPVMLIGVDGSDALAALARPLPHYGSYGWLAFRDGERLARGRWPVREPSLTWQAPKKSPQTAP